MMSRQRAFINAAPKLAACISRKSLTLSEINQINKWSTTGAAVQLYDWILTNLDLSIGKPQDLIRAQYASLQVAPTDSMATVSKKINLKWWLYVQHTMFDHTTDAGQREGLWQIFVMLMSGPTFIAQEATFSLTTVENTPLPYGAVGLLEQRCAVYDRYAEQLGGAAPVPGALMLGFDKDGKGGGKGGSKGGGKGGGKGGRQGGGPRQTWPNTCSDKGGCRIHGCKGRCRPSRRGPSRPKPQAASRPPTPLTPPEPPPEAQPPELQPPSPPLSSPPLSPQQRPTRRHHPSRPRCLR